MRLQLKHVVTVVTALSWLFLACVGARAQDTFTPGKYEGEAAPTGTLNAWQGSQVPKVLQVKLDVTDTLMALEAGPMSLVYAEQVSDSLNRQLKADDPKYLLHFFVVPGKNDNDAYVEVRSSSPSASSAQTADQLFDLDLPPSLWVWNPPGSDKFTVWPVENQPLKWIYEYSFDLSLAKDQLAAEAANCITATVYRTDGSATTLTEPVPQDDPTVTTGEACKDPTTPPPPPPPPTTWRLGPDDPPLALLEIDNYSRHCNEASTKYYSDFSKNPSKIYQIPLECDRQQYILVRNGSRDQLIVGMHVGDDGLLSILSAEDRDSLFDDPGSLYAVNGDTKILERGEASFAPAPDGSWTIDWQDNPPGGCRASPANDGAYATLVVNSGALLQKRLVNGILVGVPKVFDVGSLQMMLNSTASQLAAISGFNASSITAAFGNLQGISQNASYLSGQVTTTPLPTVVATNPGTTTTIATLQCPDGSLPSVGTGNVQSCAVPFPPSGSTGATTPTPTTFSSTLTTTAGNPPTTSSGAGGSASPATNTVTTSGGFGGTVPTAPTPTPLTAPSNVGVGSADILAEQVQLNSQITTLELLLQGALSDRYLLSKQSKALAQQQQTTLGFAVSLDPPRQYKHAVAEIHVIIVSKGAENGPSIVNLLPAEKTYNVAKVTSHQNAFGAGAVIEPVSFGVTAGNSKNRLYLAKDTDTLALQFPLPFLPRDTQTVGRAVPQWLHDAVKSALEFQKIGGCEGSAAYTYTRNQMEEDVEQEVESGTDPIDFGWQFRPVLGADYVQGGERQVFAQLALGVGMGQSDNADVYIETLWREYNPDTQVVGAVYGGTCSLLKPPGGVNVLNQPGVRDVTVNDLGAGQLKLSATGDFFTSSINVLSGQNTLPSVFFDGKTIDVFGNAHDLMEGGDLKVVGQNGQNAPFAIPVDPDAIQDGGCGVSGATLHATPRPDGNSLVDLDLTLGSRYTVATDGEPRPFVLIGNQVFGLRESPFVNEAGRRCERAPNDDNAPYVCTYEFLAPTTALRNAQTFIARDLAWDQMQAQGRADFLPSFTAATALGKQDSDTGNDGGTPKTGSNKAPPKTASGAPAGKTGEGQSTGDKPKATTYEISGYDFRKIAQPCAPKNPSQDSPCLQIFLDSTPLRPFSAAPKSAPAVSLGSKSALSHSAHSKPSSPHSANSESSPTCDFSTSSLSDPGGSISSSFGSDDSKSPPPSHATFTVVSDNLATVCMDGQQGDAKLLRLQIYWANAKKVKAGDADRPDPSSTIEWDLTLAKPADTTAASVVASPAILHIGDSQIISFTGPNFANFATAPAPIVVTFDSGTLVAKYNAKKKSLDVPITTAITKVPGHKEMTVTVPAATVGGTSQPTTLPFDVVKD